jgi:preprotein translocase subunit YajC
MGNAIIAASTSKSSGSGYIFLVAIVVLFGLLYFVTIRPQRNRQRAAQQTQRQIQPGMRVRTTAGMYATVTAVEDQEVVLEVAPGVNVRFLRRAIMDVVPDHSRMEAEEPAESETFDEAEDDDVEAEGHAAKAEDDAAKGG